MAPFVTIGITTFNRLEYLKVALNSALNQDTTQPYEILVIDDCSSDGTEAFFANLREPKIRYTRTPQNVGGASARNHAVQHMSGDFVLWLDDDDVLLPHALSSQLNCLKQNPNADIVYANLQFVDDNLQPRPDYLAYQQIDPVLTKYRLLIDNMLADGGTMIRKTVFDRAGGYDPSFVRCYDYDLWGRAVLKGCHFVHNNEFIYLYRAHQGNCVDPRQQDPEHHQNYARVVTSILANGMIEEIFPMFDWKAQADDSFVKALNIIAMIYLKWDSYENALDIVNQSLAHKNTREGELVRALIYKMSGNLEQCAEQMRELVLSDPKSQMDYLKRLANPEELAR